MYEIFHGKREVYINREKFIKEADNEIFSLIMEEIIARIMEK